MRLKKKSSLSLIVLATALVFLGVAIGWWLWVKESPSSEATDFSKIFVIQKGEGLDSIAPRLKQEGLIRSSLAFKLLVLFKNYEARIQAGDFRLSSSMDLEAVAQLLTHGTLDVWLTFPEGWRREEFACRLAANLGKFDTQSFLDLTKGKEGYLFPDTYLIPQDATAASVLKIFTHNFEAKFNRDLVKEAQKKGLTQEQVVILASIIEREAGHNQDRPLIAGILLKRWRSDWLLQVDAAVQYEIGTRRCKVVGGDCDYWEPTEKADLKIDSPYNTYRNKGLPPTPICNPGLASIKAVIYPEESNYWFYLSDHSGKTHYARTNEEHDQNISRYLR